MACDAVHVSATQQHVPCLYAHLNHVQVLIDLNCALGGWVGGWVLRSPESGPHPRPVQAQQTPPPACAGLCRPGVPSLVGPTSLLNAHADSAPSAHHGAPAQSVRAQEAGHRFCNRWCGAYCVVAKACAGTHHFVCRVGCSERLQCTLIRFSMAHQGHHHPPVAARNSTAEQSGKAACWVVLTGQRT
jgi:hypothetical protein